MKQLIYLTITTIFLSVAILAQKSDFQIAKTPDGMIVVNNNKSQRFSLLVAGANARGEVSEDGSVALVTDSPAIASGMTIFCVKKSDFPKNIVLEEEGDMLKAYKMLSVLKLQQTYNAPINLYIDSMDFVKITDSSWDFTTTKLLMRFYWSFLNPAPQNTIRSFMQAAVIGDQVLVMGNAFRESVKIDEVKAFFKKTTESITLLPAKQATVKPKKKVVKKKSK
jgi:hypothetical protein